MKTIIDKYIYYTVRFNLSSLKDFWEVIMRFYANMDAIQGKYIVDAKSLLGMHSLNLLEPIVIKVYEDDLNKEEQIALDKVLLPLSVNVR